LTRDRNGELMMVGPNPTNCGKTTYHITIRFYEAGVKMVMVLQLWIGNLRFWFAFSCGIFAKRK